MIPCSPSKASPRTGWRMILSNWAKCIPLRSKSSSCVSCLQDLNVCIFARLCQTPLNIGACFFALTGWGNRLATLDFEEGQRSRVDLIKDVADLAVQIVDEVLRLLWWTVPFLCCFCQPVFCYFLVPSGFQGFSIIWDTAEALPVEIGQAGVWAEKTTWYSQTQDNFDSNMNVRWCKLMEASAIPQLVAGGWSSSNPVTPFTDFGSSMVFRHSGISKQNLQVIDPDRSLDLAWRCTEVLVVTDDRCLRKDAQRCLRCQEFSRLFCWKGPRWAKGTCGASTSCCNYLVIIL